MKAIRHLRFIRSVTLLLLTLWIAFPKSYVHSWLDHRHGSASVTSSGVLISQKGGADCDFENFSKPLSVFVSTLPLFVGPAAFTSVIRIPVKKGITFRPEKGKLSLRAPPACV